LSAAALVGLLIEGLVGPLAPDAAGRERAVAQSLALVALRALGVADGRARGDWWCRQRCPAGDAP